jgi:mannose-6-phosphate isomerase
MQPLRLARKLDSRIWGGDRLGAWLKLSNPPAQLAESWQVYEHNTVSEGDYAGRTLADVATEHGAALLGTRVVTRYGNEFPLLAKFIDAADHLSVQVHPDDAYAHSVEAHSGFHGKTEAWYIIDAMPDADLIHGLQRPTDRATFASAVANNTILDLLRRVPTQAGDTIFVPAGTVHAINAGVFLFEIQQKSDLTYRVYDYDRRDAHGQPRELHLERALDVINYQQQPIAKSTPTPLGPGHDQLVTCDYFTLERWQIADSIQATTDPGSFEIITSIAGDTQLAWNNHTIQLQRGESLVLPASLGAYSLHSVNNAVLLRCFVP